MLTVGGMEILGYHGTNRDHYNAIKLGNFLPSKGEDHWLGCGAYFFIDGVSKCPKEDAEEWAHVESFDPNTGAQKYSFICVVEAAVTLKDPLDLRDREVLRTFNQMRSEFMARISKRIYGRIYDPDVIAFLAKKLDIDGVIADLFFKVKALDRRKKNESRLPNCTVLCVVDPKKSISLDSIHSRLERPADHERN